MKIKIIEMSNQHKLHHRRSFAKRLDSHAHPKQIEMKIVHLGNSFKYLYLLKTKL